MVWPGATAEDVERSITIPIEQELRSVEELDKITSTSARNVSLIILEFPEGTDMGDATTGWRSGSRRCATCPRMHARPRSDT